LGLGSSDWSSDVCSSDLGYTYISQRVSTVRSEEIAARCFSIIEPS
jgi:hypothetical protein